MGRESMFTQALADEIVQRLSSGETLAEICRSDNMPTTRSVYRWCKLHSDFELAFGEARDAGFDEIATDTLGIIDEVPERVETKYGDMVDSGFVTWQKNRVEQRMKLLAKWDSRRYGDRIHTEHSGELTVNGLAGRMRQRRTPDGVDDLV